MPSGFPGRQTILKGQLPRGAALFKIISQLSQPGNGLHPLRDVDAEQVHAAANDTRHLPGQPETHRAGRCILFPEDRMVMVVSVELLGQFVDIGADDRGGEIFTRGSHDRRIFRERLHQVDLLGQVIGLHGGGKVDPGFGSLA